MKNIRMVIFCLMALAVSANRSQAEEAGKHTRLFFSNVFSARSMPLGLGDDFSLTYRYYYSGSDNLLWRNNHIGVGVVNSISPATNSVGAFIEFEPIAIFNLRVQYEYVRYFGAFTSIAVFPDKNADYSDSVMDHISEHHLARSANGTRFIIAPTFQAQYWRFIVLNALSFEWFEVDKDDFFYHPTNDTLMETEDYFFQNMAVVGFELWKKDDNTRMFLGSRYTYFHVEGSDKTRQQLDGAFIWMMGEKLWFMENPLLLAAAGGYLEDRYREKDVFFGMMFSFEYTLGQW